MERPDEGRRRTDEALAALEQQIASVYEQAAKELQPEIDGYFSQFAQRDAQQKALLEAGEITEEGYKQWRLAQIGRGRRLEALRDQVAERVTRANETAAAYVNDATPGIYTLNRNYAAYTIEQAAGEVGFTLWDEQTVKRLSAEQPELMPYYPPERAVRRGIDLAYGKQQVTAGITSSILQGRSVRHMADDLQRRITAMSRDSAIRTARTAATGAQNAGRLDGYTAAEKMGIRLKKEWLATLDSRTRHSHAALDGERRDNGQPFSNGCMFPGDPSGAPKEVYNCFIGETQVVSDGKIVRSYKHKYEGELIKIETASGVHFSCTPNHPILTPRGWVAAAFLNDGDDLLIASIGDDMNAWGNPHINHIFPRMDALHEFFNEFFGKRTCALGVNFHGDIPATDVEIVTHKRFLWDDGNLSGRKSVYELLLKLANKSFMGKGAAVKHLWCICKAALRFVRGVCKPLSLIWRSLRHPGIHRFGASADGDTGVIEPAIDNLPTDPVFLCEFLDRLPCKVFTDNIIRINRIVAKCHVYNLQTATGHYFVNTSIPQTNGMYNGNFAIAHNCRCTLIADVEGVDASDALRRGRDGLLPDMTFAQWEAGKRGYGAEAISPIRDNEIVKWRKSLQNQENLAILKEKIDIGEISTAIRSQQQAKHIDGTPQFEQYKQSRLARGQTPQSILTISELEAQSLIDKLVGTGTVEISKTGENAVKIVEFCDADIIVGKFYDRDAYYETRRFEIYYAKRGTHIVPVKEDYHG